MAEPITLDSEIEEIVSELKKYDEENIAPLADVGNPEDIIHKKYENWTPQDVQLLKDVYVYDSKPLEDFIAKKEIERYFDMVDRNRKLGA